MKVDPFIVPIPEHFLNHPDVEVRDYFRYLVRFLHDLWKRTGGGDDLISTTIEQTITGNYTGSGALAEIFQRLEQQNKIVQQVPQFAEFNPVSANINTLAAPYDFVNATNNCQITLPHYGSVIVRNGDASRITIWGGGRDINGEKFVEIRRKGTALFMQYFVESDEWFIR